MASSSTASYKLSGSLVGHADNVKAVVAMEEDVVYSASRDGTARQWQRTADQWEQGPVFAGYHEGFVNAAAHVDVDGQDYLLTGGQDSMIQAWPIPAMGETKPAYTLLGHAGNVCALHADRSGRIVSGSWDHSAKVWRNFELEQTLQGHNGSVLAVLAIEASSHTANEAATLTGCADALIRLYRDRKPDAPVRVYKGHTQPVRALVQLAEDRFVSAGNDGSIRIFTFAGDAITKLAGHDAFIYSLATLPDGSLVSCGEDRSVRVWRGTDGECEQVIVLPAVTVWSVATTPNGDIVAGSSDNIVRVFTRRKERVADEATLKDYETAVSSSSINATQIGDVKKTDLPGTEALLRQGKKEGEVIMVKNGLNVEAHQWDVNARTWTKIGDVVDAVGSGKKKVYQGQEYDYVFDVDVKEGSPPLKLPFNANQNPLEAAHKFLEANELPAGYADQVVEFIEKNTAGVALGAGNTDPYTGASSYRSTPTAGSSNGFSGDPYTGTGSYRPPSTGPAAPPIPSGPKALPHREPITFAKANLPALTNKLKQLNEQHVASSSASALSPDQLATLDRLPAPPPLATLQTLLRWPPSTRFPALDLVRILNLPDGLLDLVLASLTDRTGATAKEVETNAMLALRAIANGVALGSCAGDEEASRVLRALESAGVEGLGKTGKEAMASVALNYSVLAVKGSLHSGGVELVGLLSKLLEDADAEVGYRSLVACGNVLLSSGLAPAVTPETAQSLQARAIEAGARWSEARVQQLVAEIGQL